MKIFRAIFAAVFAVAAPMIAIAQPVTDRALAAAQIITQVEPVCAAPTLAVRSPAYVDMMVNVFNSTPNLAALERSYPGIAQEASQISQQINIEILEARSPKLCADITKALAERLPENHLVALSEFQASPIGRRIFGRALEIYLAKAPEWFENPELVGLAKTGDFTQLFAMQAQFQKRASSEALAGVSSEDKIAFTQFLASPPAQEYRRAGPGYQQRVSELRNQFMTETLAAAEEQSVLRIKAALNARIAAKRK